MPRTARADVFHDADDYQTFLELVQEKNLATRPMRIIAYCLMPNHFHLLVWPRTEGELSRWMPWVLTTHVRRYHRAYQSTGHVWQGRFNSLSDSAR